MNTYKIVGFIALNICVLNSNFMYSSHGPVQVVGRPVVEYQKGADKILQELDKVRNIIENDNKVLERLKALKKFSFFGEYDKSIKEYEQRIEKYENAKEALQQQLRVAEREYKN